MFEVNEKNNAVLDSEHYDGATLKDVYGAAYRPEGNKARYIETRVYLQQVRDEKHRVDLIKSRIQYRKEAGLDTSEAEQELAVVQDKLKRVTAEVAEEISKLYNVNLEMTITEVFEKITAGEMAGWALAALFVLLSLIQVSPLKLNPWDNIFAWVGKIILEKLGKPESLITHVADRHGHDQRYAIDPAKAMRELGWKRRQEKQLGMSDA